MAAELLQFAAVIAAFVVAALLWVYIIYVPGRTMEDWQGRRPARRVGEQEDQGRST